MRHSGCRENQSKVAESSTRSFEVEAIIPIYQSRCEQIIIRVFASLAHGADTHLLTTQWFRHMSIHRLQGSVLKSCNAILLRTPVLVSQTSRLIAS